MSQSIIDIIMRTKKEGDAPREESENLKSFGETVSKVAAEGTKIMAGLTAAVVTFKKTMDLGEQGAEVVQMGQSWDFLMEKIGASPTLLEELRAASNGTISDMSLMSSTATLLAGATDEMAQEMANAAPEIMEIAKAAAKLNPGLGDAAFLYESLMTGIKRGSPLMIDNAGVTFLASEAYAEYADRLGKSADELTSNEQKLALLSKTMEAGGKIIEQVGGDTESATDKFQQLDAAFENLGNSIKADLSEPLADAANGLRVLLEWSEKVGAAKADLSQRLYEASDSYEDYVVQMLHAKESAYGLAKTEAELLNLLEKQGMSLAEAQMEMQDMGATVLFLVESMQALTAEEYDAIETQTKLTAAQDQLQEQMAMTQAVMEGTAEATGELNDETREGIASQYSHAEAAAAAKAVLNELKEAMFNTADATDYFGGRLAALEYNLVVNTDGLKSVEDGLITLALQNDITWDTAKQGEVLLLMEAMTQEIAGGIVTEQQAAKELADALGISYDEALKKLQETKDPLGDLIVLLSDAGVPASEILRIFQDVFGEVDLTNERIQQIIGGLEEVDGMEVSAIINLITNGSIPTLGGFNGPPQLGNGPTEELPKPMAFGGQFTIPSGFPNDSYPLTDGVRVQSGETVTVTPAGRAVPGSETTVNVYLDSRLIQQILYDGAERQGVR
ncbi:MAG: hypothetical protein HPY85_06880 [Anaerolineae bacterium]|nr:hypothetical protein [Anaerolineae bacterium]